MKPPAEWPLWAGQVSVRRLLGAALLVLGNLTPVPARARELVDAASVRREALPGVKSFSVRVDILAKGYVAYGLTAEELETEIEDKFRRSRFAMEEFLDGQSDAGAVGFLQVMVNPLDPDSKDRVYAVQVGLYQRIKLSNPERQFLARIWGNDVVRAAKSAAEIREIVDSEVDLLLGDLAAVNPGELHPLPDVKPDPLPAAPSLACLSPSSGHGRSALRVLVKDEWGSKITKAGVRLSRTGEPAREYAVGQDGVATATVTPGVWHVDVVANEYNTKSFDLEVPPDKMCATTAYLPDATFHFDVADAECPGCGSLAALVVHVTDQVGGKLPGVQVEVGGTTKATSASGEARFDELQPGKYVIRCRLAGFDQGQIPITAAAGRQILATAIMTITPVY